jgi:hypothetical protein
MAVLAELLRSHGARVLKCSALIHIKTLRINMSHNQKETDFLYKIRLAYRILLAQILHIPTSVSTRSWALGKWVISKTHRVEHRNKKP